jgi:hypothetical protein
VIKTGLQDTSKKRPVPRTKETDDEEVTEGDEKGKTARSRPIKSGGGAAAASVSIPYLSDNITCAVREASPGTGLTSVVNQLDDRPRARSVRDLRRGPAARGRRRPRGA